MNFGATFLRGEHQLQRRVALDGDEPGYLPGIPGLGSSLLGASSTTLELLHHLHLSLHRWLTRRLGSASTPLRTSRRLGLGNLHDPIDGTQPLPDPSLEVADVVPIADQPDGVLSISGKVGSPGQVGGQLARVLHLGGDLHDPGSATIAQRLSRCFGDFQFGKEAGLEELELPMNLGDVLQ